MLKCVIQNTYDDMHFVVVGLLQLLKGQRICLEESSNMSLEGCKITETQY